MNIGETPEQRQENALDESIRFKKGQRDGVYYDEFRCPIPAPYIPPPPEPTDEELIALENQRRDINKTMVKIRKESRII